MDTNNKFDMKSTTIYTSDNNDVSILINVFVVDPHDQEKLVTLLEQATESVICTLPGFISANIHKSLDGTRVVNYAQWKSKEDFEAMLQNPQAKEHLAEAFKLSQPDPHLYEVVSIHRRSQ
jgi:heme-degrading monooxygenase HmoA